MICLLFTQGIFGVGQSTAKVYNKETSVKVRFKWVLASRQLTVMLRLKVHGMWLGHLRFHTRSKTRSSIIMLLM